MSDLSERIQGIKRVVEREEGPCFHVHSVPVREMFGKEVVWEGVVEVFSLTEHPTSPRCYAWSFVDDHGKTQFVVVLDKPPVQSPQTAVKAYVASLGRK